MMKKEAWLRDQELHSQIQYLLVEELSASERRYQELVEHIREVVFKCDGSGKITFLNRAWTEMLGYPIEESIGCFMGDYLFEEDRDKGVALITKQMSSKNSEESQEVRLWKQDGELIWLMLSVRTGEGEHKVGSLYNIDERKRAEDALQEVNKRLEQKVRERTNELKQANQQLQEDILRRKEAEEKLRYSNHLLERTLYSLRDAVFILDADTFEIIDCNPAASEIFGYSRDEMIGQTTPLLHIDRIALEAFRKHLYAAIKERGFLHKLEFKMKRKDGTVFSTEHSVTPLIDEKGKRTGWVSVVSDITEKQKLEEELLKARRLESIGTLAGGIAHDYNNILTGILGNLALAQIYTEPKDKVSELLTEAEKASLRAKDLTRKLLTFSRGGVPVRKRASIVGILSDAVDLALSGSQVTSEYSLPEDLWPVEVDEAQIRQAIHNIVINAKEAMPEGGTIAVSADNVTVPGEEVLPLADGQYIRISIKDQGRGMSHEYLERIFDPYFTTKEMGNQKGLGLGLSISHSIVKRHNGHINVESSPETGTTFSIYLPACETEIFQRSPQEKPPTVGGGQILVMDDEEIVRDVAGEMLAHLGYEVTFAKNGDEAIKLSEKASKSGEPFAAAIMDLTIPGGMGGREAIKKMLEIDPTIKAIVSSGYSNDPVMTDFKRYGFCGVVTKPYKIEELRKTLHGVITGEGVME